MTNASPREDPRAGSGTVEVRDRVVHLRGDFDRCNEDLLRSAIAEVSGRPEFVVDLTECTYLDSGAIGVFFEVVDLRPRLRSRPGSIVARVLTLTGFGDLGLLEYAD